MADVDQELPVCRICWDSEPEADLIRPCRCEGSGSHVHSKCLDDWLRVNPSGTCAACQGKYRLPNSVEIKRAIRRFVQIVRFISGAGLGIIFVTAFVAKPLGIIMWFGLSATNSNPFDAPMLLSILRSKETFNGIEEDIDQILRLDKSIKSIDFLNRLTAKDCAFLRSSLLTDIGFYHLQTFLNNTCDIHALFGRTPQLRFCECEGSSQRALASLLIRKLRQLPSQSWVCRAQNLSMEQRNGSLVNYSRRVMPRANPLLNMLLPIVYPRFQDLLIYIQPSAKSVNWTLEKSNPRFYGIPVDSPDSWSRPYVIKGLDLHLAILLTVGVVVDFLLVVGVLHNGLNPLDPLGGGLDIPEGSDVGGEEYQAGGFGWSLSALFQTLKAILKAQWESLLLTAIIMYQSVKIWWYESSWLGLGQDFLVAVGALIVLCGLYVLMMMLISVVVLVMFETEILA